MMFSTSAVGAASTLTSSSSSLAVLAVSAGADRLCHFGGVCDQHLGVRFALWFAAPAVAMLSARTESVLFWKATLAVAV